MSLTSANATAALITAVAVSNAIAGPNSGSDEAKRVRVAAAGVEIAPLAGWRRLNHSAFSEIARWGPVAESAEPSARLSLHIKPLRDYTLDKWMNELAQRVGATVEDTSVTIGGRESKKVQTANMTILACVHKRNIYALELVGKQSHDETLRRVAGEIRFTSVEPPHLHLGECSEEISLLDTGWAMNIPAPLRLEQVEHESSVFYGVQNYITDKSELGLHVMRGETTPERSFEELLQDISVGVKKVSDSDREVAWRKVRQNVAVMKKLRKTVDNGQRDPYQIMGAVVRYENDRFLWLQFSVFVSSAQVSEAYVKAVQSMVETITPP